MDKEIEFIKQDGNLVTLRATRKFLEDLIVFLKDTPAIGEEFWNSRDQYAQCLTLLDDLEDMLAHEEGDVLEFQRDKDYFFDEMNDAMGIDLAAIEDKVFAAINALHRRRIEEIREQLLDACYPGAIES
ncbi:MAG: hypothetical protein KDJ75_08160 [Alphaproteobacteria bacterium]|nr:hypothetical protein [Alphaproteobacteria bacterium]